MQSHTVLAFTGISQSLALSRNMSILSSET
uniref:Uncharacterized protein n=1 Tax=Anguilla anguilla TaxID=7936 RepID=A0A0E9S7U1_ANGAN